MVELLAPAGSREALLAAIESGANAVYLAGNMFGARAYADNFDEVGMREAIRLAHLRGVHVHVTVNTIVDDQELPALRDYLRFLYDAGADAILVQDLGVARIAQEEVPDLPLHASTQMTVHNLDGVLKLQEMGFTRVVLSRELTLEAIRHICANCQVEIETFIHGALCVCYSGQCLMSSIIGGRSGNRGRCAQPCRLPYTLVDENDNDMLKDLAGKYLLSPRDMNTIELIPQLIEAGVASLKIEGRMKRPEYVAVVVGAYRRAIDSYYAGHYAVPDSDKRRLLQIFNRDFTTAYLEKKQGRNMMSDRRPNNRGILAGRVQGYDWDLKLATVKLSDTLREGDQLDFWVKVGGRVTATIQDMELVVQQKPSANANAKNKKKNAEQRKSKGNPVKYVPVTEAQAGAVVRFPVNQAVYDKDRAFKVYDAQLMEEAKGFYNTGAPVRRIPIEVKVYAAIGRPLSIEMRDGDGNYAYAETEFIGEVAKKRPLPYETVEKQISRLGTSVFSLGKLDVDIDGEVMVPVSEINEARRKAVEQLEETRLAAFARPELSENDAAFSQPDISGKAAGYAFVASKGNNAPDESERYKNSGKYGIAGNASKLGNSNKYDVTAKSITYLPSAVELAVICDTQEKVHQALSAGADLIVFGGESYQHEYFMPEDYHKAEFAVHRSGKKIYFNTPRIIREANSQQFHKWLEAIKEFPPDAVNVHNIGTLKAVQELTDIPVHADYSLISYNAETIAQLKAMGLCGATLSPELNMTQVEALGRQADRDFTLECLVEGNLELMVSEYCVTGSFLGGLDTGRCSAPCCNSGKRFFLKDRKDVKFPLVMDQYCHMHVLNGNRLSMLPHAMRFGPMGIKRLRIDARYMSTAQLRKTLGNYRKYIFMDSELSEAERSEAEKLEGSGITRGHYFRGVL